MTLAVRQGYNHAAAALTPGYLYRPIEGAPRRSWTAAAAI